MSKMKAITPTKEPQCNQLVTDGLFDELKSKYPLQKIISKLLINKKYNAKIRILKEKLCELRNSSTLDPELLDKIFKDLKKSGFELEAVDSAEILQGLINKKIQKIQEEKQISLSKKNHSTSNQEYDEDYLRKTYNYFYNECKARDEKEGNDLEQTPESAYKMLILFGDLIKEGTKLSPEQQVKTLDNFIKKYASQLAKPVHDIFFRNFLSVITHEDFDLDGWRSLINKAGLAGIRALESGIKIQEITKTVPFNTSELKEALSQVTYKRKAENPLLASICIHYEVSEDVFNQILDLKLPIKQHDNLPDITIKGENLGENFKGYYMVRLPAGDYRGLILGYITNCCQSVGNHGASCAIDGTTNQNSGFYLLIKAASKEFDVDNIDWDNLEEKCQILGQGYLWCSKSNNLTFDSWENVKVNDDIKTVAFLKQLARVAMDKDASISRFTIGLGGKTPQNEFSKTAYIEQILEGSFYGDALEQGVILESIKLKSLVEFITKYTARYNLPTNQFTSITHAAAFLASITKNTEEANRVLALYKDKIEVFQIITSCNGFRDPKDTTIENIANYSQVNVEVDDNLKQALNLGIKFSELANIHEDKRKELISHQARRAYESGKIDILDLVNLDIEKIKLLISYAIVEAYKANYVKPTEIKELTREQIEALFNYETMEAYKSLKVKVSDLIGLDAKKIKFLTSRSAIEIYDSTEVTIDDLKDLDIDKLEVVTSYQAKKAYQTKKVKVSDLKSIDADKIPYLIYDQALKIYEAEIFTINELAELSTERIGLALLACYCHRRTNLELEWLQTVDIEKLKLIVSDDARRIYKPEKYAPKLEDLKDLDSSIIKALISWGVVNLYELKIATVNELKTLSIDQIKLFTSQEVLSLYIYRSGIVKLNDLIPANNILQIKLNFLNHVIKLCQEHIDIDENIDNEELDLLISKDVVKVLLTGAVKVSDLKKIAAEKKEKLKLLTSCSATQVYESAAIKFADLRELEIDKINFLIQFNFVEIYKAKLVEFQKLDTSHSLYELKYSFLKQLAYKLCDEEIDNKNLNEEKLDALISLLTIEVANNRPHDAKISYFKINALKSLGIDKIQFLMSPAKEVLTKGWITINDIRELNLEKLKLLTSHEALRLYETGKIQIRDLKDLSTENIKFLLSNQLNAVFQEKYTIEICNEEPKRIDKYKLYLYLKEDRLYYKALNQENKVDEIDITEDIGAGRLNSIKPHFIKDKTIFARSSGPNREDRAAIYAVTSKRGYTDAQIVNIADLNINISLQQLRFNILQQVSIELCQEPLGNQVIEEEQFNLLVSHTAIEVYKIGAAKVSDLLDLTKDEFNHLINWQVLEAYKTGAVKAHDLKGLKKDKIDLLVSSNVMQAYHTGFVNAEDLRDLDKARLELLTSDKAISAYKSGKVKPRDLKDLDPNKISLLIYHDSIEAYKSELTDIAELKNVDIQKIPCLVAPIARLAYKAGKGKVSDLIEYDIDKIRILTSQKAIYIYSLGISITDLRDIDTEKLESIISDTALEAYKIKALHLTNLKDQTISRIKIFTSPTAIKAFRNGAVNFDDLKDIEDEEKIKLIISWYSKLGKENGVKFAELNISQTKIKLKYSFLQQVAANLCHKNIDISESILEEKFDILTSQQALEAYKTKLVTINDLIDLDIAKIKLLISENALEAYKTGVVKVADIKLLGADEISASVSWHSIESHNVSANVLSDNKVSGHCLKTVDN